jgi:hypothetical protein
VFFYAPCDRLLAADSKDSSKKGCMKIEQVRIRNAEKISTKEKKMLLRMISDKRQ